MSYFAVITGRIAIWIVNEITSLRADQRDGFVEWLEAHCEIGCSDTKNYDLENILVAWFESLPAEKVIDELSLFLTEISWWRRLSSEEICNVKSSSRHIK
jgi:hypothetical protein